MPLFSGQPRPAIRRVFITGASSGIGAALAREYARQGALLGLAGRDLERLRNVSDSLGVPCATYVVDVRNADAMREAAADFMMRHGTPDVVIANAGVSRGTMTEYAEDQPAFRAIFETNVLGLVHTFQPFLDAMRQHGGTLVGIASVAGLRGLPGAGAYSASKAAAINYLESLRVELVGTGIHVTTLCPGYIRTPMTDVNTHVMPFLIEADIAARQMVGIIAKRKRYAILPWQMAIVGRLMHWLPAGAWDFLLKNAPRKPR